MKCFFSTHNIDSEDQNYISFRLASKEKDSAIDKYFKGNDLKSIKPFKYKIVCSDNLIRCFINDLQIKEIDEIPINEENLHSVRFHLWGLYKNSEISLKLSNLLIEWD
ncbi:MAG: hypothetical protein U9O59_05810 [Actinomycetota bacterium]|nr:hypothetical protein [Actinomycetota bacterium]